MVPGFIPLNRNGHLLEGVVSHPQMPQQENSMNQPANELLEKLRQQFDAVPYPKTPLEMTPRDDPNQLYIHNLVTPFYLRDRQVITTEGKSILDAGCGTGYTSLVLACANPGARVVGVDLSEESVRLARQRLEYHGFDNVEFHATTIEDLKALGMQFDYINVDEVLYLLPDPIAGLQAMKAVLKPGGIIRANFHSHYQRFVLYRAQKFFKEIDLMEGPLDAEHLGLVRRVMRSLKPGVNLKSVAWRSDFETEDGTLVANFLLRGDKSWTIPEFFAALGEVNLEFISMVNWWQWNLADLFEDFSDLPLDLVMGLAEKPIEQQLHLFELLHPVHRLLDLWCGHRGATRSSIPPTEWTEQDWHHARVHFHPQLNTPEMQESLRLQASQSQPFELNQQLNLSSEPIVIDPAIVPCLLPLIESPQSVSALIDQWQQTATFPDSLSTEDATHLIRELLVYLESQGYLLLELPSN